MAKRRAAEGKKRSGYSRVLMVRCEPHHITLLRTMARRAELSESAFVRKMIEVHAKLHEEIAQAAERATAEAERRTMSAIADVVRAA